MTRNAPASRSVEPDLSPSAPRASAGQAWYTLGLLFVCYLFNQVDRNILSMVADDIKHDLGLTDARIGFLYGTAFSVFYVVFGVPFGRLADAWVRRKLISIGLFAWSLMTAASGTARNFATLAACRVGVGIGEASLSPAAYSMLFDVFAKRRRGLAISLYQGGGFLGTGVSFAAGGLIVDVWNRRFPDVAAAPFHLHAWQVAFFAVGVPGLLLALWMWTLPEPPRDGESAGGARAQPLDEVMSVVPPLTLVALWRAGAGRRGLLLNLAGAAALALVAAAVIATIGETAQWTALAIGLYAAGSWAQSLRLRDRDAFDGILGSRTFWVTSLGFGTMSFVSSGLAFWTAPFLRRSFEASPTRIGALMGVAAMAGGWLGVVCGGLLSDRWKARRPSGRVDVGLVSAVVTVPLYYLMTHAATLEVAVLLFLLVVASNSFWIGIGATSANELVPARMRSTASAVYLLVLAFVGFAIGPFTIGKLSDALAASGQAPGRALGNAMFLSTAMLLVSVSLLWRARGLIGPAEERLRAASGRDAAAPVGR